MNPRMRKIDQYLVSIASAAPTPASAPQNRLRSANERRNRYEAAAHTGISKALELNLSGWKLNPGENIRNVSASARLWPSVYRAAISQANHNAIPMDRKRTRLN